MTSSSVEAIALVVLTGMVGFASYIAATRANRETAKAATKSIDAEAFDRQIVGIGDGAVVAVSAAVGDEEDVDTVEVDVHAAGGVVVAEPV